MRSSAARAARCSTIARRCRARCETSCRATVPWSPRGSGHLATSLPPPTLRRRHHPRCRRRRLSAASCGRAVAADVTGREALAGASGPGEREQGLISELSRKGQGRLSCGRSCARCARGARRRRRRRGWQGAAGGAERGAARATGAGAEHRRALEATQRAREEARREAAGRGGARGGGRGRARRRAGRVGGGSRRCGSAPRRRWARPRRSATRRWESWARRRRRRRGGALAAAE